VELDLDQLVRLERKVDFLEDVGGQAVAGDGDGRVQVVRGGAQRAARRWASNSIICGF